MRVALVVGIVAATGCYAPNPAPGSPCSTKGECPRGLACRNNYCELPGDGGGGEGQIDGAPDAVIDACPGAVCMNDELVGCGASITCEGGCSADPEPHCRVLRPANQITTALLQGATADFSTSDIEIDTSTGRINAGSTELRSAGTGIINGIRFEVVDNTAVFAANSFIIPADARWDIDGSNPLVLYAATTITIDGNLDATATLATAGAGGVGGTTNTMTTTGCRGRAGRLLQAQHGEGGGGGGGATAGGNGGPSDAANPTGMGGPACTTRSTTIPLRGGAGGGAGGSSSSNAGGGGGGAVALVAMDSITVTSGGVISVSGGGGISGIVVVLGGSGDGGGGGGAGGAILLEAPLVTVMGALTANGGSGASPSVVDGRDGNLDSADGILGGLYSGPGGMASGGNGAGLLSPPTNGQTYNYNDNMATPNSVISRGGGGGGAVGRIELRASVRSTAGAVISPAASTSNPDYE